MFSASAATGREHSRVQCDSETSESQPEGAQSRRGYDVEHIVRRAEVMGYLGGMCRLRGIHADEMERAVKMRRSSRIW